jgi:CubicO group peptidase (beta-lactamase class C family)
LISTSFIFDDVKKRKLEQLIDTQMKKAKMHTLGIIITDNTTTLYQKIFGENDKATSQTPFVLGSVSKSFTALSFLKLKNATNLINQTLDKFDLGNYLDQELLKDITVGELLNHTSGLDSFNPKRTTPKGKFSYSNFGYSLLGKVIEKVSNMKYSEYVNENIFKPLEMVNSRAVYDESIIESYDNFLGARTKCTNLKSKMNQKDGFHIPAGFISSSIEDMGKYLRFYLNKENADYVSNMTLPSIEVEENQYYGMGLFMSNKSDYITYHHNGATSSFLSDLYVYPKLNLGFLIVVNTNDLLCVQPSIQFVTTLINFLIYNVYDTYDGVDSSLFFFIHFTYDFICLSIILIPTVYLGITIARKVKRKKYTWFIDIKGKILFGVDVLVLLILPIIILIICFTDETREFICTNVKDILFTIITVCVALWLNFIIKIVYIILYKKFNWEDGDKKGKIDNIEMINSGEDADNDNKDYNIMES